MRYFAASGYIGLLVFITLVGCSTALTESGVEQVPSNPVDAGTSTEGDLSVTDLTAESPSEDSLADDEEAIMTGDGRSEALKRVTSAWGADWTRHTVDYSEIISGGPPRDGIPSIDNPHFENFEEAEKWLAPGEPVIALEINGEARAYPLSILTRHEIANDQVGGVPVAVTFCPLCNSALVFNRRVGNDVYEFGVSGLLRNSDLIMYDRTTESLWQQFTGEGIVGIHAGDQLDFLPAGLISFGEFQSAYPDGAVLSRNTGIYPPAAYGTNPYVGYDNLNNQRPFLFMAVPDERLPAMMRVVGVAVGEEAIAYPYSALWEVGVINDTFAGADLVVFHVFGMNSALGDSVIAQAEDVGATGVFNPVVGGERLTFSVADEQIVDDQTGSVWNLAGQAVSGELEDTQLERLLSTDHFWFSWAAFYPGTQVFGE